MKAVVAFLLLPIALDLFSDVLRELRAASPADQAALFAELPARIEGASPEEKNKLAILLIAALDSEEWPHLRVPALAPLLACGLEAGTEAVLRRAYALEESVMRAAAREALFADRTNEVTGHLASFLRRERSPRARAWLALFLGVRGRVSIGAGETLLKALSDESFIVRGAAAEALTRIWGRTAASTR